MDVGDWLRSLGFGAYAEAFAGNGIDLGILAELTNDDLKDLGVARLADRRAMLKAIALLPTNSAKRLDPLSSTAIGERRQVAVLFADLTDFTRLSIKIGAEETHAMLNRYFELVDGIIESYGGRVDKHIGDNVMAVFGAPIAHHDDSLRAVFAAIEIHERITSLTTDSGSGLPALQPLRLRRGRRRAHHRTRPRVHRPLLGEPVRHALRAHSGKRPPVGAP